MNAPRHAGSLDPLEFSLVEFCQLVDFLLDIVSLVSFFFFFVCSIYIFYLFVSCFHCVLFSFILCSSLFSHWFNGHFCIGFNFQPHHPFHSLFSHFHLSCFSLTFGSDIHLESLCSVSIPLLFGVPTIRGSCQCITPLHLPSLSMCSFYTGSQKACD